MQRGLNRIPSVPPPLCKKILAVHDRFVVILNFSETDSR